MPPVALPVKLTVRGACPEVGEAFALAPRVVPAPAYSYAPISYNPPCGREMPSKSLLTSATVAPALIHGELDCKWKLRFDRPMNFGSMAHSSWLLGPGRATG